ncbi:Sulfate adenylyltransferase [Hondaea fermentalgiana]|uniref:sulfate adenylyltransferase n=1 Tax=Hondaea fermentalgiana TaxID=2315210 RepID=A0A2R5GT71_9STRA|nr:Sulfate adenylyltransferase [Hondaea fermentalgiana]|eukprot:GBG34052.1 Sulfate adenylyltransferase [Hondaea fermentalgiana]
MRSFMSAVRPGRSKAKREQRQAQKTKAEQAQAVQNKGQVEDTAKRLQARVEHLERQQKVLAKEAKVLAAKGNKQAAISRLRKKKMINKEVEKLYGAISNLEQQAFAVESAIGTQEVIKGLRVGKDALKTAYDKIDVDELHDLQDDVAETMQTMEEVDNLLAEPLSGYDFDEDDLAAELAELDQECAVDDVINALPSAPLAPVPKPVSAAQAVTMAKPSPVVPPRPALDLTDQASSVLYEVGQNPTNNRKMQAIRALGGAATRVALGRAAVAQPLTLRLATRAMSTGIPAHGGELVDLMVKDEAEKQKLKSSVDTTMELSDRNACDVELLVNGGFSPLTSFMNQADYESVVERNRLTNDVLFGLPVVLDTDREDLTVGKKVLLQYKGEDLAVMDIEERYTPDKVKETNNCYKTTELAHPGTMMVALERGNTYLSGALKGLQLPTREIPCQTPREVREMLPKDKNVVVFQCRNPLHRAHVELFLRSAAVVENNVVLVHPTVGPTQQDDISGAVRYKTYLTLQDNELKGNDQIVFAYLPYSMQMAGPREALQHMIIRKNYCQMDNGMGVHFIVGRDMAGSKSSITGEDYYGAYDAQEFAGEVASELGMGTVPSLNLVYCGEEHGYMTADKAEETGAKPLKLSGTEFRKRLRAGEDIPEWFAYPSVVKVLRENL